MRVRWGKYVALHGENRICVNISELLTYQVGTGRFACVLWLIFSIRPVVILSRLEPSN